MFRKTALCRVLLHVFHGDNALDHGEQNNGNDDELQQIDEDITEGLQIVGSEIARTSKVANQANNNTGNP